MDLSKEIQFLFFFLLLCYYYVIESESDLWYVIFQWNFLHLPFFTDAQVSNTWKIVQQLLQEYYLYHTKEGKIMRQKYVNDLMNYDIMNKNFGFGYLVISPSINLVFLKSANCTFYWILEHDSSNTDVCFPKREKLSVVVSDAYN